MNESLWQLEGLLEEYNRRKQHQFAKYVPLPKQLEFHKSTAYCRLLLGGNRSGKSRTAGQEILWEATETHPYQKTPKSPRIWVIAPEYRIIYEGIWFHLRNNLPDWEIDKIGSKIPGWEIPSFIRFKSGSQIDFISAEGGDSDRKKLQAAEIDHVHIDEEVEGDLITELTARLVTRGGKISISATLVNSVEWLLEWEQMAEDPKETDYEVFRLNTELNVHNNKKALERWMKQLSPEERLVRIEGRSRTVKGLYYKPSSAFFIDRIELPSMWPVVMVLDVGFRVSAGLWFKCSPDGYYYIIHEMYLRYTSLTEVTAFIRTKENWNNYEGIWLRQPNTTNVALRISDPSDFNTQKDGTPGPAEQLAEHYGLEFIPGNNNKDKNIDDVRRLLVPAENPKCKCFNDLVFFRSEIVRYRSFERKLKPNTDNPKDRPMKKHDHLMNCWEYFASYGYEYNPQETSLASYAEMSDEDIPYPKDPAQHRQWTWAIAKLRQNRRLKRKDY